MSGDWTNHGTFLAGSGEVRFSGSSTQTITNPLGETFYNLTVDKAAGDVQLNSGVIVNSTLSLRHGDLNLNGHILTLGSMAILSETPGSTVNGESGYLETTRSLNAPDALNVAGLGFEITASQDLGTTHIIRGHMAHSDTDIDAISRYYDISPENNSELDASLVFAYDESELNGLYEPALGLFRSVDTGDNWALEGGATDVLLNSISLESVEAFSRWTAAIETPDLSAPSGYVVESNRLSQPHGLAIDSDGNLIVATRTGDIYGVNSDGTLDRFAHGFQDPVGLLSEVTGTILVSDRAQGQIYRLPAAAADEDAGELNPIISGLDGPTHMALGSDGFLYVSLSNSVVRIDRDNPAIRNVVVSFPTGDDVILEDPDPRGLVFEENGDLVVVLPQLGEVRRIEPPYDEAKLVGDLEVVLDGLTSPNGITIGLGGRTYVATATQLVRMLPAATQWESFLTGLLEDDFNNVIAAGNGTLWVAERAAGRFSRVVVPNKQVVATGGFEYHISRVDETTIGHPGISGSSDEEAIANAFMHWENVGTASVAFQEGEPTSVATAGADGLNIVTFTDDTFLFPDSSILAVAAKTWTLSDDGTTAEIVDADMVFNPQRVGQTTFGFKTDSHPGTYDLESVATHEVGHMLGIFHSVSPNATMLPALLEGTDASTLEFDDRAELGALYPGDGFEAFGSISGFVADGERLLEDEIQVGEPIAGAAIVVQRVDDLEQLAHAFTDKDGMYEVRGLPDGQYRVILKPLNGSVFGYFILPDHISEYMKVITTKTDYPGEWWNGTSGNETWDPMEDDPNDFDVVAVSTGQATPDVNFVTNIDITPPTIVAVFPAPEATGIDTDTEVLVTFSEPIDTDSFDEAFRLEVDGVPVDGNAVFIDDVTAVYTPNESLAHSTTYTIRVDGGIADKKGNVMPVDDAHESTFQTAPPDEMAPTVAEVTPADESTGVFVSGVVTALFSEPINPSTVTESSVFITSDSPDGPTLTGTPTVQPGNTTVVFEPPGNLSENTTYYVHLTQDIKDTAENSLVPHMSQFDTVPFADPEIEFFGPADGATNVSFTTPILVDFSEPVSRSSAEQKFRLYDGDPDLTESDEVGGSFEWLNGDSRMIFRPAALAYGTTYHVAVEPGITDLSSPTRTSIDQINASFTTAGEETNVSITFVTPSSAAIGKNVVVNGTAFDPDPSRNTVTFNGVEAAVTSSTLTSLTTSVPAGAESGDLIVEVDGVGTTDAFPFVVVDPLSTDVIEDAALAKTSTGSESRHVGITPDGSTAYVTHGENGTVTAIDLTTTGVVGSIAVGSGPFRIAIGPFGKRAYVTNFSSHDVSVIDIESNPNVEIARIPVGLYPWGIQVMPDGSSVYVAESVSKAIAQIDVSTSSGAENQVVARTTTGTTVRDVGISPDGVFAVITGEELIFLNVDPESPDPNSIIAKTTTGTETRSVAISPDGVFAAVSTMDGEIWFIDLNPESSTANQVIAKTSTGGTTRDVAISPDGQTLFASNYDEGIVEVFEISFTGGTPKDAGEIEPVVGGVISLISLAQFDVGGNPEGIVIDSRAKSLVVANGGSTNVDIIKFSPTAEEGIYVLMNRVTQLLQSGVLTYGDANTLMSKLTQAADKLAQEKRSDAVKKLEDFIKTVDQLVKQGLLDQTTANELAATANELIDELNAPPSKGGANEVTDELPTEFALKGNYPNPFNPTTTIEYDIPGGLDGPVHVQLEVYNVLGQRVAVLVNQEQSAGRHHAVWNGRSAVGAEAASGVYLFRIQMGDYHDVRKMTLLR